MPPKKATKPGTKAQPAKRKADKDEDVEVKEVLEKAKKPVKKVAAPKKEKVEVDKEEEVPQKQQKTTKASTSKKGKTEENEEKSENENGVVKKKVTKSKKTKDEETDTVSSTSEEKKPAATRGRRAKKVEEPEEEIESQQGDETESRQAEEEVSDSKKGRKRKVAPKANKKETKTEEPAAKTSKANATSTDWETVDFKCAIKNSKGKTPNFHIVSWNVDGLRAWLKKGGLNIVEHDKPDIFCLQEIKCSVEKLPEEVTDLEGYEMLWCCSDKEGYAGVGIATKVKPLSVTYGIGSEEHDTEGRCITAEYEEFFLVNVYVPNAGRKLVTLPKRLEWNKLFKEHIKKLDERKPVIICGDMNVAHSEIDLANPKTNTKNAGFTVEEREGMTEFLDDGYVDTFRRLYPDKEKAYTFWTYMANARAKNVGWRLDYFIVSERMMENVCDNIIHSQVLGSDHCPLALHINI